MYTKQQKIDALCEVRGFDGTNEEKLAFITDEVVPQIEVEIAEYTAQLQVSLAHTQAMIDNLPATAKEELNREAEVILINKDKEAELEIARAKTTEL